MYLNYIKNCYLHRNPILWELSVETAGYVTWNAHDSRLAWPLLHHTQKISLATKRTVACISSTPFSHPGMSYLCIYIRIYVCVCVHIFIYIYTSCCFRYWAEGNDIWMQQVSSTPSTSADVIQLKESLDTKLQQRRAGQLGICPIRSELYSQCLGKGSCRVIDVSVAWTINRDGHREDMLLLHCSFLPLDELIRQMAVNCAERGLLLFRIGDEIQTTVATYKTLYESSIAFGIRKRLLEEQGNAEMEKRVKHLHNFTARAIEC